MWWHTTARQRSLSVDHDLRYGSPARKRGRKKCELHWQRVCSFRQVWTMTTLCAHKNGYLPTALAWKSRPELSILAFEYYFSSLKRSGSKMTTEQQLGPKDVVNLPLSIPVLPRPTQNLRCSETCRGLLIPCFFWPAQTIHLLEAERWALRRTRSSCLFPGNTHAKAKCKRAHTQTGARTHEQKGHRPIDVSVWADARNATNPHSEGTHIARAPAQRMHIACIPQSNEE